jgi:arylformamidase
MHPPSLCAGQSIPWQGLSLPERAREYSPSSAIGGNYQPFIEQYVQRSAAARAWFAVQAAQHQAAKGSTPFASAAYDISYGAQPTQRLDMFLPPQRHTRSHAHDANRLSSHRITNDGASDNLPPLLVFIHGGYWQELSKHASHFAAVDAVQHGLAHAVLGYTLAPAASVAGIVDECVLALLHLHTHASELGFDARRMVVAGSSAGAHLAAMVALRCPFIRGTILVSGIYELEPLIHTNINDALGMDAAQAQALSPQQQDVSAFPPSLLAWGEVETTQFKQQSRDFAARLPQLFGAVEIPLRNHFDVILDLLNPATALGKKSLAFTLAFPCSV